MSLRFLLTLSGNIGLGECTESKSGNVSTGFETTRYEP
jgi:hypothetical protein